MHYTIILDIGKGLVGALLLQLVIWLVSMPKWRTDRLTAREQMIADGTQKLIDDLQGQVSSIRKDLSDETARSKVTEEENRSYRVAVDGLADKITELERQLRVVSDGANHWKQLAEERLAQINTLQARVAELEARVADLESHQP